jgi:hypothetical protein
MQRPPARLDGQNMAVYDFDDELTPSAGRRLYPYAYRRKVKDEDEDEDEGDADEYDDEVTVLVCRGSSQSQVHLTMLAEKHPNVEVLVLSNCRAGEDDVYGSSSKFDSWGDTIKLVIMLHVSEGLFCNVAKELERVCTKVGTIRQRRGGGVHLAISSNCTWYLHKCAKELQRTLSALTICRADSVNKLVFHAIIAVACADVGMMDLECHVRTFADELPKCTCRNNNKSARCMSTLAQYINSIALKVNSMH